MNEATAYRLSLFNGHLATLKELIGYPTIMHLGRLSHNKVCLDQCTIVGWNRSAYNSGDMTLSDLAMSVMLGHKMILRVYEPECVTYLTSVGGILSSLCHTCH